MEKIPLNMLHYAGNITAMQLGAAAKQLIPLYSKLLHPGATQLYVPFKDLVQGKKRYVKFERFDGVEGWNFVDLCDMGS